MADAAECLLGKVAGHQLQAHGHAIAVKATGQDRVGVRLKLKGYVYHVRTNPSAWLTSGWTSTVR